jgi:hypothetical protein
MTIRATKRRVPRVLGPKLEKKMELEKALEITEDMDPMEVIARLRAALEAKERYTQDWIADCDHLLHENANLKASLEVIIDTARERPDEVLIAIKAADKLLGPRLHIYPGNKPAKFKGGDK